MAVPEDQILRQVHLAERLESSGRPWGRRAGSLVRLQLARRWGVYVNAGARLGRVFFAHPTNIVIGAGTVIEDDVTIYQGVTLGARNKVEGRYPVIRAHSTLFAGAVVIGGVTVGPGATVGANSVVLEDVPPGSTAVGVPARVVRTPATGKGDEDSKAAYERRTPPGEAAST